MKLHLCTSILSGALALGSCGFAVAQQGTVDGGRPQGAPPLGHTSALVVKSLPRPGAPTLTVTTPAFRNGDVIPVDNTQNGKDLFPGLSWTPGPAGTRSYAVVVQGQSLGNENAGTSIHLMLYNIPANVTTLAPGLNDTLPPGAAYGPNVHGVHEAYAGPHTHPGAKNGYHYQVLALDTVLKLDPDAVVEPVLAAMAGHVLAAGDVVGVSENDTPRNAPAASGGVPKSMRVDPAELAAR